MTYHHFHVYGPKPLDGVSVRVYAPSREAAEDELRRFRLDGQPLESWHYDRSE